jgi:glycosyltransferase involved in cell wall biosynthesis
MKVTVSVFGRFHAFNLAKQLQNHNHLHKLISTYPNFAINNYGINNDLIYSIWYLEVLARSLPRELKSWQWRLLEQFDLEVAKYIKPDFDIFVGWSGAKLKSLQRAKEMGITTIVERGSSHIRYQTRILEEEYEKWGLKFNKTHPAIYERELAAYQDADMIAIPSIFVKRTFIEQGIPESKLIHIPYGTSLEQFYQLPKKDNIFRVIHCGGISLRKGVQYLLQAFYELNLPDAELWLVGSLEPEIKPFLAKYQSENILLKGKYPQNQLLYLYSQCSVFCLASIEEGLAMVIPQAMACGLPIIHTTNTGAEDMVRPGLDGFSIPIRDVNALKEKISFFYENPEQTEQMSRNVLERAQSSWSWDMYGKKIIDAYSKVLYRGIDA